MPRNVWTTGKKGKRVYYTVNVSPTSIVVKAIAREITPNQLGKALAREFPAHQFYYHVSGKVIVADADRFTDDLKE